MSQKVYYKFWGTVLPPTPPPPPPLEKSIPITTPASIVLVRFPITPSPTIPHPTLRPTTPLLPPPQLSAFSSCLLSIYLTMSTCHVIMSMPVCHVIMSYHFIQTKYDYQWIIYMYQLNNNNMMNTNLTLEELREEIYNNFIQEYYNLSHEEVTELVDIELTKYKLNTISFG